MRFCVVALNPAVDAEWCVDDILWEEKNVVHAQRRWAGGKGINVARWLKFLGAKPQLLIPLGGTTGREIASELRARQLNARVISLCEDTRVNVVVTTAQGRQMRFNPPGPKFTNREWQQVLSVAQKVLSYGTPIILSGALPRGIPVDAYAQLIQFAHRHGQQTFLDCDGEALVTGVKAKPFFVKPNIHELSRWACKQLRSERAIISAAQQMSQETSGWVLVSGGAEGAWLVNVSESFVARARPPRVRILNTVGAGDALLASVAYRISKTNDAIEWLRAAVTGGTAATQCKAGQLPTRKLLREISQSIRVTRL